MIFEKETNFFTLLKEKGIETATNYYTEFKSQKPDKKLFTEAGMNALGYSYFSEKDYNTAIKLFEMNVAEYPDSWNAYDSLGEAYLALGNKEKAREYYRKSVELNPDNENGRNTLEKLNL